MCRCGRCGVSGLIFIANATKHPPGYAKLCPGLLRRIRVWDTEASPRVEDETGDDEHGRHRQHLRKLAEHVQEEHRSRLRLEEEDDLPLRVQVLRKIIHDAHGYQGDDKNYDDIQNANFIRVIERRKARAIAKLAAVPFGGTAVFARAGRRP